jgi:membrane associated rhomboid family serine protease
MGLYDRDYTHTDYQSGYHYAPQMRLNLPKLTPAVKWLLIINIAVFFLQILGADEFLTTWFSVFPYSVGSAFQLWRLISYQFLHGGTFHLVFNMIGLYFLGPTLEGHWGSNRFVRFYLGCGTAGGLFYILLAWFGVLSAQPMVGASGAILGLLAACAILFPQFIVFFFFFPVPIRIAAVILILIYTANLLSGGYNAGGDAAHLAGMAAGAAYIFSESWRDRIKLKRRSRIWEENAAEQRKLQMEVDRILQKVYQKGIHSLSREEKRILQKATKLQQMKGTGNS